MNGYYPYPPPSNKLVFALGGIALIGGAALGWWWLSQKKEPKKCSQPTGTEGDTTCIGSNLYLCKNGKWDMCEANSPTCTVPPPPACTTDADCPAGYNCINGRCVFPPPDTVSTFGSAVETRNGQAYRPLSGATIQLINTITRQTYTATTDDNGEWELGNMTPAYYDFKATKTSYAPFNQYGINLTEVSPFAYMLLPAYMEKLVEYGLSHTFPSPQYSIAFDLTPSGEPGVSGELNLSGTIIVGWCPGTWRNIDIWTHYTDNTKEKLLLIYDPGYETTINKTFTPSKIINKISLWGGAGWLPGQATCASLKKIDLTLKKIS